MVLLSVEVKRIEILYEDDICLVLNKPAGLAVQGGKGVQSSLDAILRENWTPPPLLVHRLDKDTSGIMLVAKTKEAAACFSRLFGEDRIAESGPLFRGEASPHKAPAVLLKQYLAVCAGKPDRAEGRITLDLEIKGSVKKSETRYRLLQSKSTGDFTFSLLELELGTGRMHQIRRHLALSGIPVLGDDKYGDFALNRRLRKTFGLKHLLLHAYRLLVPLPQRGNVGAAVLDLKAPLPPYFESVYNVDTWEFLGDDFCLNAK